METPSGRWLGLKVSIATAITIVCDIVDGKLLFGIHDCNSNMVRRQGGGERYAGQEVECSTRPRQEGEGKLLCKRHDTGVEKEKGRRVRRESISIETGARCFLKDFE